MRFSFVSFSIFFLLFVLLINLRIHECIYYLHRSCHENAFAFDSGFVIALVNELKMKSRNFQRREKCCPFIALTIEVYVFVVLNDKINWTRKFLVTTKKTVLRVFNKPRENVSVHVRSINGLPCHGREVQIVYHVSWLHYYCFISKRKCRCAINNNIRQHNFIRRLRLIPPQPFFWLSYPSTAKTAWAHHQNYLFV